MKAQGALGGVVWSTLSAVSSIALGFGVFVLLARLLSPAAFGLVAVAGMFAEIAGTLARAGIAEAIVQRETLEDEAADTAFWLCALSGAVMSALFYLAAPWLALPFGMPELVPLLQVLSVSFVISGLSAAHEARITRGLGFRSLTLRNIAANIASGIVAVGMALTGWGVWALIAQRLVGTLVSAVLVWVALPWMPRLRFSLPIARQMLAFGTRMLGSSLALIANGRIHEVIAALCLDAAAVGLLRVGWRCMDLIMQVTVTPAAQVAMPLLSRLQSDPPALRARMVSLAQGTAVLAYPAFLGFAAVAPSAMLVLFGEKWSAAAQVTQVLCLLVLPAVPSAFAFTTLNAMGKAQWGMNVTLVQVAIGAALSLLAAPFGVVAMAVSHVVRAYLLWPLVYWLLARIAGLRVQSVLRALSRPLLATLGMAIPAALAHHWLVGRIGPLWTVLTVGAGGAVLYALLAWRLMPDAAEPILLKLRNRLPLPLPRRAAPGSSG
ncbi:lipopolysaccharide biosynthesis protein [Roseomonas sp. NAR14]|uniref:Lipopolysaccharide biosynthesis protein n=1 Tax=Roseomonas acroporae TaxID=2937791 RepID=A0A9X1YH78_9PROT|nr:lipopolysaccharide biosynthesis protein [Roseomonas acroporae]MCK8786151.1 lipopolysaccharide biosynthesis protein [Roseomonas acroporae]